MSRASIYRSPEGESEIMATYDRGLERLGAPIESRMIDTRKGRTHVLAIGPRDARPLVLLGGGNFLNPAALEWFLPLAAHFRIYSPDIIGQPGRSAPTRPSPKGNGHAEWLADVLDGLDLGSAPFVGLSYGAGIVLRLAGYAPARISRAVLVSPSGLAAGSILRMVTSVAVPMLIYRVSPNHERLLAAVGPLLTEIDEGIAEQIGAVYRHVKLDRHLPRMATSRELAGFGSPTLVFAAAEDIFFPGEAVLARAREVVPNLAETESIVGCRHIPSAEGFARINRRILGFLQD